MAPAAPQSTPDRFARRRKCRRVVGRVFTVLAVLVVGTEFIGRWCYGLGSGRGTLADPDIEYLPIASAQYSWLGHREWYNQYSMRSDPFPARRTSEQELRVMVLGDSVVNGGARIDQTELATHLLRWRLHDELNRPVTVGNIAAFSWGPPNLLAYVRRFGFFDADVVLIVTNNSDAWDIPGVSDPKSYGPPSHSVIADLASRLYSDLTSSRGGAEARDAQRADISIGALLELIHMAEDRGIHVAVIQHAERAECANGDREGTILVRTALDNAGVTHFSTLETYRTARKNGELYFDHVHLNPRGQMVLMEVLDEAVTHLLDEHQPNF